MDLYAELNTISETIARSKSVVKESIDLTRKNAERKKDIERRLKNCFVCEDSIKNNENSFTLDLENHQISYISKEKAFEPFPDSYREGPSQAKSYSIQYEKYQQEKNLMQNKYEELQDLIKELEEENFRLKGKIKSLVSQIKSFDEDKEYSSAEYHEILKIFENLRAENQRLSQENKELYQENREIADQNKKLVNENFEMKINLEEFMVKNYESKKQSREDKNFESISGEYIKKQSMEIEGFKDKNLASIESSGNRLEKFHENKEKPKVIELKTESSTENYLQYFKNLKNEALELNKNKTLIPKPVENEQAAPIFMKKQIDGLESLTPKVQIIEELEKNENIIEKLEENYKKTDEKFKKLSKNFEIKVPSGNKKLSSSYDSIKVSKTENSKAKPKLVAKVKHKRANAPKGQKKQKTKLINAT